MAISYIETLELIGFVMSYSSDEARLALHGELRDRKLTEPQFCRGVIEHGSGFNLTADQWFDFFSKVPNKMFFDSVLMNKLTPSQRQKFGLEI